MLTSSAELFEFLCRNGGLDTEYYDAPIEKDIRDGLGLSTAGDLRSLLIANNVSIERFVGAFFQAAEPYAQMMSDLLRFFERSGAQENRNNVEIEFDFGTERPQLDFDLDTFRHWVERWKQVRLVLTVNFWDIELLWSLINALNQGLETNGRRVNDASAHSWLEEYERKRWPSSLPSSPVSGHLDLDARFARVWNLWTTVVRQSASYGPSHEDLRIAARDLDRSRREVDRSREPDLRERDQENPGLLEEWPARVLLNLNADSWSREILVSAYLQVESIASGRTASVEQLEERLDEAFGHVDSRKLSGTELLRYLDDFLNLPIWKYRHELYSAWVSTQIIESLETEKIRVHQYDGVLEFAFSGTHLATLDSVTPRLHLWAEMRSPLASPVGKGRKKAIQPDYSLIGDPVTTPLASILEVECKQYRRSSSRNFSAALTDYARGRPNASVILVNYGPTSDRIMPHVAEDVRDRTHLIGEFRPGNDLKMQQFRDLVKAALLNWKHRPSNVERRGVFVTPLPKRIVLKWGNEPTDLDLHLVIRTESDTFQISYKNKGSLEQSPWAMLLQDVRDAHGPEEIKISRWIPGRYECYVHKFGDDGSLVQANAKVKVFYDGGRTRQFSCPRNGKGDYWHVFTLDMSGALGAGEGILKRPRQLDFA